MWYDDPDCAMFHDILTGKMHEDVFHDQMRMQESLIEHFRQFDEATNNGSSCSLPKSFIHLW